MVTCQSSELGWEVTVELPTDFLSLGRGSVTATAIGNLVEHTTIGNSALVFDSVALHFHIRSSHGFSMLVCSGLEDWC